MKYAVVIDSVATLPESIIQSHPVKILPVSITIDGEVQPDTWVHDELAEIYASGRITKDAEIDTIPPTAEEIHSFIMKEVVPHYDYAVCQTVSAVQSPIYGAFEECANHINIDAKSKRNALGIQHPFYMSYVNSATSNAGQGLLALYAETIFAKETPFLTYRDQVEKVKLAVRTYTVVKDVLYTRNRAKRLGIESIALPTAFIGQLIGMSPIVKIARDTVTPIVLKPGFEKAVAKVCNYASEQIKAGLYLPIVNVAFAGPLEELEAIKEFAKLKQVAKENRVNLIVGMMSLCACINYSPGSFSLGIAPKNQKAEPE